VDKRKVRHDHADFFCTTSEGIRGKRALDWRLVDELIPRSQFEDTVHQRAQEFAAQSDRPADARGIILTPLQRTFEPNRIVYPHVTIDIDRDLRAASFLIQSPQEAPLQALAAIHDSGADFWPLALARELDDAIMHLRLNEDNIGTWVLRTTGDSNAVQAVDAVLDRYAHNWLVREVILYLKRTLQRLDVSSRSLITLIEPGSCFTGTLLELVLAADRSYMLDGVFEGSELSPATLRLSPLNFGPLPMVNGMTRLARRFLATPERLLELQGHLGEALSATRAEELGLVTFIPDDIDWQDEVRLALEERASFSPDALTGLEASLRFGGTETLESKIFGRLSAWQNWIFQRPNAAGEAGALTLYGTGKKSVFDTRRV
jgi:benzoyl-CoA-dihydrodiol lyase